MACLALNNFSVYFCSLHHSISFFLWVCPQPGQLRFLSPTGFPLLHSPVAMGVLKSTSGMLSPFIPDISWLVQGQLQGKVFSDTISLAWHRPSMKLRSTRHVTFCKPLLMGGTKLQGIFSLSCHGSLSLHWPTVNICGCCYHDFVTVPCHQQWWFSLSWHHTHAFTFQLLTTELIQEAHLLLRHSEEVGISFPKCQKRFCGLWA